MRFKILGTPCIEGLAGTSGRRATILGAMLTAHVNKTVSIERLIDAIWEDRPPATAREQVQNCVSALRRSINKLPNATIARAGNGYQLRTDPHEVDAYCFERSLRKADGLAAAGQPEPAIRTYRIALAIWQGPALDGLDASEPQALAHRLNELRAAATERLIEALIELDRVDEAVAELRLLVRLHPMDERYLSLLVRALLQSHRQSEALAAYQEFAARWSSEFGGTPGATAQAIHQQIQHALQPRAADPKAGPYRLVNTDLAGFESATCQIDSPPRQALELVDHLNKAALHIRAAYSILDQQVPSRTGPATL